MKLLRVGLVVVVFCLLFRAAPASALTTAEYIDKPESPVIISGYSFAGAQLDYVQLFNTSDTPVDISGWSIEYTIEGGAAPIKLPLLSGILKPSNYVVTGTIPEADLPYVLSIPPEMTAKKALSIQLKSPDYKEQNMTLGSKNTGGWTRHLSDSTGKYTTTFDAVDPTYVLYVGGLYDDLPESVGLQISEILANPRNCSPLDTSLSCKDYVKFYNPTSQDVDLSKFRLRLGYQGQSATTSNTYELSGIIPSGHYGTVSQDVNGRPLSITNGGGFVWLEDTYGIKRYDNTVQGYADASPDNKKGAVWAYDESDGTWKWTARPTPGDEPSVFVDLPVKAKKVSAVKTLIPCRSDQYRSAETNRCRSIASAATNLTPCKPGQARNPETNRCRSLATAISSLTPCKANQERNPETNRCRNKISSIPDAAFAVEPVKEAGKAFVGWWALGGVGALALGYGAWEWRREVFGGLRKVGSFIAGRK